MARWTGTWLSGLGAAGVETHAPRGGRLGLPAEGVGSVAGFGIRSGAFAIDAVLSGLVARLFFPVRDVQAQHLSTSLAPVVVLAVVYLVGLALTGQTLGMRLLKLRVRPVPPSTGSIPAGDGDGHGDGTVALGLVPAGLRTALLILLVPALITDQDGRGLHDRAAGTVVVRA